MNDLQDEPERLDDFVAAVLPQIDETLAGERVGLRQRPFHAAITFVADFVLEVAENGQSKVPRLEDGGFAAEGWFAQLYQLIEEWYRKRYGPALDEPDSRHEAIGFLVMWGTPFLVRVPPATVSPGKPGETIVLHCSESVLPGEEPAKWVVAPPNTAAMNQKELRSFVRKATEVGSLLRSIEVKVLGIVSTSEISRGLIETTRSHLRSAAKEVAENWERTGMFKAAWEIQMACECALKALSNEKVSSFRQIHDLFLLYDDVAQYLGGLKRAELAKIPRWRETAELRYGQGHAPDVEEFYKVYLTALRVVIAAITPLVSLTLDGAHIELAKAPWKAPRGKSSGVAG